MNRMERLRLKRKKKWMAVIILIAVIALVLAIWYYRTIQNPLWSHEEEAEQLALMQTEMVEVQQVYTFVNEQSHYSVLGVDDAGNELLVWLSPQDDGFSEVVETIEVYPMAESVSREDMKQKLLTEQPEADILRVQPGKLYGRWVWEIFYKRKTAQGTRRFYDYYHLADGEWLDTYRLALER